jgi:hypothetical protein
MIKEDRKSKAVNFLVTRKLVAKAKNIIGYSTDCLYVCQTITLHLALFSFRPKSTFFAQIATEECILEILYGLYLVSPKLAFRDFHDFLSFPFTSHDFFCYKIIRNCVHLHVMGNFCFRIHGTHTNSSLLIAYASKTNSV